MKVLIAQSYFRVLDPKEMQRGMPYPPLGALMAAVMLRNAGHEVVFFDSMIASSTSELYSSIDACRPDVLLMYDDEFNYLSKMCLSNMRDAAVDVLRYAEKRKVTSLIFSSDATDHPRLYLEAGARAVLTGEAEITAVEVLAKLSDDSFDRLRSGVLGIKYLEGRSIIETSRRPLLAELDGLPDPDFQLVDISAYKALWHHVHGYFSLNVSTTRGCPFHCNWCAKPIYGQVYHVRSAAKVVEHIKGLKERYAVDHIWMTDDIFGLKPGWLEEFADQTDRQGVRVPFKCLTRADLLLRGSTIKTLRRAGCRTIWIGAESGSQKILDAMDKGTTVGQIYEASQQCRLAGIDVAFFIQFGYPGEAWVDIGRTRRMIRDLQPVDIGVSVSYPLPGTEFYDTVSAQLKSKTNWTDSDDLDLMYVGTFSRDFYKVLHRFVHLEYRMLRAWHTPSLENVVKWMPRLLFYLFLYAKLLILRMGKGSWRR